METNLDFLTDVLLHISEVSENLEQFCGELRCRGHAHDRTKLMEPEFSGFVSTREKFKKADYGSKEYEECCDAIRPVIDHHYQHNRHHTDHHHAKINGMTLVDLMEMLADWKAAERRSPNKSLADTLDYAYNKYQVGEQLQDIINNTLRGMGWL